MSSCTVSYHFKLDIFEFGTFGQIKQNIWTWRWEWIFSRGSPGYVNACNRLDAHAYSYLEQVYQIFFLQQDKQYDPYDRGYKNNLSCYWLGQHCKTEKTKKMLLALWCFIRHVTNDTSCFRYCRCPSCLSSAAVSTFSLYLHRLIGVSCCSVCTRGHRGSVTASTCLCWSISRCHIGLWETVMMIFHNLVLINEPTD